jgi:hypothetical protein
MAELGVTQELFIEACEKASANPLHKKIVDQITAVDNFIAFKKLMVKRNTELNEMAQKMLSGGGNAAQQQLPPNSNLIKMNPPAKGIA